MQEITSNRQSSTNMGGVRYAQKLTQHSNGVCKHRSYANQVRKALAHPNTIDMTRI